MYPRFFKFLFITVSVVICLFLVPLHVGATPFATGTATSSSSAPIAKLHFPNFGTATVHMYYDLAISGTGTVYDGSHVAFCVEDVASGFMNPSYLYSLSSLAGSTRMLQAAYLIDTYYPSQPREWVQLAVWEVALGSDYDIATQTANDFYWISGLLDSTSITTIEGWFDSIPSDLSPWENYVLVSDEDSDPYPGVCGKQDYLIKPVPEPATILLIGFGLMGPFVFRRRLSKT